MVFNNNYLGPFYFKKKVTKTPKQNKKYKSTTFHIPFFYRYDGVQSVWHLLRKYHHLSGF